MAGPSTARKPGWQNTTDEQQRVGVNQVRLRRPIFARLFGTVLQGVLTVYALASLLLIAGAVTTGELSHLPLLFVLLVLDLLWLRGLTAWCRFDASGIHSRFWARWDFPWDRIGRITLRRLDSIASQDVRGPPVIVISQKGKPGDNDYLVPARRCGRHRREFATELIKAARSRGIPVVVGSSGWAERQETTTGPYI